MDKGGRLHTWSCCWSAGWVIVLAHHKLDIYDSRDRKKKENIKDDENENNEAVCTSQAWEEEQCACLKDVSSGRTVGICSWLEAETATQNWETPRSLYSHHHHSSFIYNLIETSRCQESPAKVLAVDISLKKYIFTYIY